ncbi:hypothetical protein [Devosia sp.]|uniref:hypothetical protein n=1 Tax=Devosia sp. TaxID=1871048 RepID=UPI002B001097|nr:hypothetical protein [Devosia sp.]
MIATLSDVQYVEEAITALERCKTDAALSNWSDRFCNNERYISLPEKLVSRLEDAFDRRVRWVCGVGA